MIKFLNTEALNKEILSLLYNANKEVLIVVPFIKTSRYIQTALEIIDNKGTEITIICRVNQLGQSERTLLNRMTNLNLLSHPNVHAKCYFSENRLIITSLNMTAHSEKNNREMGILIEDNDEDDTDWSNDYPEDNPNAGFVSDKFYEDLINEIQRILNASEFVKKSKRSLENGFSSELLKTRGDILKENVDKLNKFFAPKKFRYHSEFEYDDTYICENYFDKFDLIIKDIEERFELSPNKGKINEWNDKLQFLHRKEIEIMSKDKKYYFTIYLNKGAKLNIVGNFEELSCLSMTDRFNTWDGVLGNISQYFTPDLLKTK